MALLLLYLTPYSYIDWTFYTPYWSSSLWALANTQETLTAPTGISHDNTPGDPFGGTLGETWVKFNASGSHGGLGNSGVPAWGQYLPSLMYHGDVTTSNHSSAPDNTKRWAYRRSFFFYTDGVPSSSAYIVTDISYAYNGRDGNWGLQYNPNGTLSLIIDDLVAQTSSFIVSLNTIYQIDIWAVQNDSSGSSLTKKQWVVRAMSGLGGTLVSDTIMNVQISSTSSFPAGNVAGFAVGEATARGSWNFWVRNLAFGWENANVPFGVIRGDRLDINAIGHDNQWDTVGPSGAYVDESGTGVPVTGTNEEDTVTPAQDVYKKETYKHSAAHYPVNTDQIISVTTAMRVLKPTAAGKGETPYLAIILSDGTTDYIGPEVNANQNYQDFIVAWQDEPGSNSRGWATNSLLSFEVGLRAATLSAAGGQVYRNADITTFVAYQKSGETQTALPAAPTSVALLGRPHVEQDRRREKLIEPIDPKRHRNNWIGILAQVAGLNLIQPIAETVNLIETKLMARFRSANEAENIIETSRPTLSIRRAIAEIIKLVEIRSLARFRSVNETENIIETSRNQRGIFRVVSEMVNLIESKLMARFRAINETLNVWGWAGPKRIQLIGTNTGKSVSSVAITVTQATRPGSSVLVCVGDAADGGTITVTDSKGNTYVRDQQITDVINNIRSSIFSSINATPLAINDTITLNCAATDSVAVSTAFEWSGLRAISTKTSQRATSTNVLSPTIATPAFGSLVIASVGTNGPSADTYTDTNTNFIDEAVQGTNSGSPDATSFTHYQVVGPITSLNGNGTLSTSRSWCNAVCTYTPRFFEGTAFLALRRVLSEVENIIEASRAVRAVGRSIVETVNIIERRLLARFRAVNETEVIKETSRTATTLRRVIAEVINILETKLLARFRSVTETENIIESSRRAMTLRRMLNETINVVESRLMARFRSVNEIEVIKETSRSVRTVRRVIAETLNIIETRMMARFRSINETENIIESSRPVKTLRRLLAETINIVETKLLARFRSVNERENIIESSRRITALRRLIAETVLVVETIVRRGSLLRRISEMENVLELSVRKISGSIIRFVAETVLIVETTRRFFALRRMVNEAERVIETTRRTLSLIRRLTETENIVEIIKRASTLRRVITETENLIEAARRQFALTRRINETELVVETSRRLGILLRRITETVYLVDSSRIAKKIIKAVNELIHIIEYPFKAGGFKFIFMIQDTVAILEIVIKIRTLRKVVNEVVRIIESINLAQRPLFLRGLTLNVSRPAKMVITSRFFTLTVQRSYGILAKRAYTVAAVSRRVAISIKDLL